MQSSIKLFMQAKCFSISVVSLTLGCILITPVTYVGAAEPLPVLETQLSVVKFSAQARRPSGLKLPNESVKLEFDFKNQGEFKAWLKQNGDWHIEGWVQHRHLRCANYALGLRFGIGSPACANVEWIDDFKYVSHHRQCNNAVLNHAGFESTPSLSGQFDKITCAQAQVKCEGVCN